MRKNVFILAAAALLFAGCAKEVAEQIEVTPYNTTIGAVIDGIDTKAALADNGTFTWQEGDKIAVYTANGIRVPARITRSGSTATLPLNTIPSGVYMLSVNGRTSKFTKK